MTKTGLGNVGCVLMFVTYLPLVFFNCIVIAVIYMWLIRKRFPLYHLLDSVNYKHFKYMYMLQHGASVNVADLWKFTPLHEAAAKGKFDICKLLLKVSLY